MVLHIRTPCSSICWSSNNFDVLCTGFVSQWMKCFSSGSSNFSRSSQVVSVDDASMGSFWSNVEEKNWELNLSVDDETFRDTTKWKVLLMST